ncbi:MAG: fibronectin type III domain-containing protein [Candidatus Eisenbacteria bacterium]
MNRRLLGRFVPCFPALLFALLLGGCGEESLTDVPRPLETPGAPTDLVASLGESAVYLSWEAVSPEEIESFRVYRRETGGGDFARIAATSLSSYADLGLVPGRSYDYRVTALGTNRIESEPSGVLTVTPGSFGMVIDGRADYTSSRLVTLAFTGPADVNAVKVANDSLFTGAFFEAYEGSRGWLLTDGDGTKTVYARFRTSGGIESPAVRDDIILDTRAEILSLVEDSGGEVLAAGDTLQVLMSTGEEGGFATITIGSALTDIPLTYDPARGLYRLVRVITPDLAAENEVVVGSFVDRAGNSAFPRTTTTALTIAGSRSRPAPPVLTVVEAGGNWIALTWTPTEERDFSRYVLYRGSDPGVAGDEEDVVVGVASDPLETGLVDSLLLRDATTYFYRVFTEDNEGLRSGSNVAAGVTRNLAPQGVPLFSAAASDSPSTSIRLTWTAVDLSTVHDFAEYSVYRSTVEAVSRSSEMIGTVGEILTRSLLDAGTNQATTYYYRIYVVDQGGLAAGSDVASATTTDLDPSFVPLNAPSVDVTNQNVLLSWAANVDPDFASYQIYWGSSTTQGGVSAFSLLDIVNNPRATSYVHYPQVADLPFYVKYYLQVVDRAGRRTESNRVQAVFPAGAVPTISNLEVTAGLTFAVVSFETNVPTKARVKFSAGSLSLNRTALDTDDYERVHSIPLQSLIPDTTYFMQPVVEDEAGTTVSGTIRSFETLSPGK